MGRAPQTAVGSTGSTEFTDSALPAQIQSLLQASPSGQPSQSQGAHPQALNSRDTGGEASGRATAAVPDCVLLAVARPGEQPITSGRGSYRGVAVYALVYPDPSDPAHTVDAYLVDADCVAPSGTGGPVLVHRTVPRP
jgi:hypothetical protein